jgi:RNA polymerase sigma-54 factor
MLKQTQTQRLVQKILPQIIQRQSLLAIPTLAIEQMIRQEIEQNPFLDESDLVEDSEDKEEMKEDDIQTKDDENEEFDWEEYGDSDISGYKTDESQLKNRRVVQENMWKSKVTLYDNLLSQLHLSGLNNRSIFIGEELIGCIDDEGYLRDDIEEIKKDIDKQKIGTEFESEEFAIKEILEVLHRIQEFEPVGIASRSLKECLLLQIDRSKLDNEFKSVCKKVLSDYFEEFRLKNYEKLIKELNTDAITINEVFKFILKLNPKPGAIEGSIEQNYIYPDLTVTKENGDYKIELNDRNIPGLRLNRGYKKLISRDKSKLDKGVKDFITNNFDRAKWFLEAIKSRRETMIKVMNSILRRQLEFFDNMGVGLKPMYEKDVAEDIEMDISTVSRTVRGKYVQTGFGIYELKYFFSNYLKNDEGDDVSTKEIKMKLKDIINKENMLKPFTDDQLSIEMRKEGYKIARRTIAKYRESMKIPKARLRRKI